VIERFITTATIAVRITSLVIKACSGFTSHSVWLGMAASGVLIGWNFKPANRNYYLKTA
jgi:hypothetical protein